MNKKIILILSLFILLTSISTVSALQDGNDTITKQTNNEQHPLQSTNNEYDNKQYTTEDTKTTTLTVNSEVSVSEGDSIQTAINNAAPGSTIIVEKGNYMEDLIITKPITIQSENAVLQSEKIAFNITSTANNTIIKGFNIQMSTNSETAILINSSDCKILDNNIIGGNIGILADMTISNSSGELEINLVNNITVQRNNLSKQNEAGIIIKAYNPIVSQNNVTDIINKKENGTATGIQVAGNGLQSEDLNVVVTDNHVTSIQSLNNSATGMDMAGNSVFDTLIKFNVYNNTVSDISAPVESVGINVGVFSLNTTLPSINVYNLNISNISSKNYLNGSVKGLGVSVTTIGQNESSKANIYNNIITNLWVDGTNSTITGLDATGVGCLDLNITNNTLTNFKAKKLVTGISVDSIDYTNFNSFVNVTKNNINTFNSSNVKGINVLSLGSADIDKNMITDMEYDNSTFITGVTLSFNLGEYNITVPQNASFEDIQKFLDELDFKLNGTNFTVAGNLSITGNNLEGNGRGTAFAVIIPSMIKYNKASYFEYNVIKDSTRKFLLESYGYDPNMSSEELAYLMLKSQEQFENYTEEELRNMSVSLGAFLDKVFFDLENYTSGNVDARYNWWGDNNPKDSKFINYNGTLFYNPWLTLRVTASPNRINQYQHSKISVDVYMDSDGTDHKGNASSYFSGKQIILSTDKGSFNGKKNINLYWENGKAIGYYRGDEAGIATINAIDSETVPVIIIVLGKNHHYNDNTRHYTKGSHIARTLTDEDSLDLYIKAVITTTTDNDSKEDYVPLIVEGVSILAILAVVIKRIAF